MPTCTNPSSRSSSSRTPANQASSHIPPGNCICEANKDVDDLKTQVEVALRCAKNRDNNTATIDRIYDEKIERLIQWYDRAVAAGYKGDGAYVRIGRGCLKFAIAKSEEMKWKNIADMNERFAAIKAEDTVYEEHREMGR